MNLWILKTDPDTYTFDDLERERRTVWDGVTNALALKHIRGMEPGDQALIYHTGKEKALVGRARVASAPYADPQGNDPKLAVVDVEAAGRLPRQVPLAAIKADPAFAGLGLVRQPRLSVVPTTGSEWERLLRLAGFGLALFLTSTASRLNGQVPLSAARAVERITAVDIARHINVIAADSMMGRDTPSRGLELTAQYVAEQFKQFGLKPGGDSGTWFQRYPIPNGPGTAPNTVGILEGNDPKLKDEYLVFSAHMDHIGIKPHRTDSIANGASNNGSGTAGVIELAKAFTEAGFRPRRSVIFLTVSGGEKGLWGSRRFVEHSVVPVQRLVANVNLDGIGRNSGDTVVVVGKVYSDLGATLDRVNTAHPELRMTAIDDPWPQQGFFSLSDQYSFAREGIPSVGITGFMNSDVHTVRDSPDKIRAEQEASILRLVFYFGQEIANADQRPTWDARVYRQIEERWP